MTTRQTLVMRTEPYEHQREILEYTWEKLWWAFFMEMGTGKSKIMIDTIVNLYLAGKIDTVLYIAKKGEYANFIQYEIPAHKPEHVKAIVYNYSGYARKDQQVKINHMMVRHPKLRIMSMNIESLRNQKGIGFRVAAKYLKSTDVAKAMIIVDESTTLKDWRSAQSKSVKQLRKLTKWCRIATGTVMPHNPVDVYNQSTVLSKTCMGYGSMTAFKADFLVTERQVYGNRSFDQVIGSKNLSQLRKLMRGIGSVLLKKDCLDLPEKVYTKKRVDLTNDQLRHYNELVDFHLTSINGDTIECVNALSVMLRLHQVVCGQLRMDDGTYVSIPNNRIELVTELMEDMPEQNKFVVWSNYRQSSHDLFRHIKKSGRDLVFMEAGLKTEDRMARIDKFKTDQNCSVFLANPQSSGFGLTLTEASTCIYFSNNDNYEYRLQSEDRIHRIGQTQSCLYIDLHSPGTVEDAILDRNRMKAMNRDKIMDVGTFRDLIELKPR